MPVFRAKSCGITVETLTAFAAAGGVAAAAAALAAHDAVAVFDAAVAGAAVSPRQRQQLSISQALAHLCSYTLCCYWSPSCRNRITCDGGTCSSSSSSEDCSLLRSAVEYLNQQEQQQC
ncbi:hypothetical protein ACSSS7_000542 [Eimeria intestinalis]